MFIESWLLEHPVNMPLKNSQFPEMLSTLNVYSQSIMPATEVKAWENRNVKCIGVCVTAWCQIVCTRVTRSYPVVSRQLAGF